MDDLRFMAELSALLGIKTTAGIKLPSTAEDLDTSDDLDQVRQHIIDAVRQLNSEKSALVEEVHDLDIRLEQAITEAREAVYVPDWVSRG